MPTPTTASVSYSELLSAVAAYLGYDAQSLSTAQTRECDSIVQSGVRQFYYPTAVEGSDLSHEWSFLRFAGSATTTAGVGHVALPDGFGRVVGDLQFTTSDHLPSVKMVSEAVMERLQRGKDRQGPPRCYCPVPTGNDSTSPQKGKLLLWPIPDREYALAFRMEGDCGRLDASTNPYPLGGPRYSEIIIESCLAVAEQRSNDELGLHTKLFREMLVAAIAQDKRFASGSYGNMSGFPPLWPEPQNFLITYKGVTW